MALSHFRIKKKTLKNKVHFSFPNEGDIYLFLNFVTNALTFNYIFDKF